MTRINVIPPQELCDQHLLAEYRELPRVLRHTNADPNNIPKFYKTGQGHVLFFVDKFTWLRKRHSEIVRELSERGFNLSNTKPLPNTKNVLENDWTPPKEAIMINKNRILERMSTMKSITHKKQLKDVKFFEEMYKCS